MFRLAAGSRRSMFKVQAGNRMCQLSIIIPTWREAENLRVLVPRLLLCLTEKRIDGEIIIVDDNSQDGTEEFCGELPSDAPVRLLVRRDERGLSSAVIHGMDHAHGSVLVCMDADLSHPPSCVPNLFEAVAGADCDFVIGSRYVRGGSTENGWGLFRWLNSRVATWLALALTRVNDPMAGFFALRRDEFLRVRRELDPVGYKIGLELLVKTGTRRVREIPIAFANRLHGESKLTLREQLNYLKHLSRLYRHRFPVLSRMAGFAFVGASGVLVDLAAFWSGLSCGLPTGLASGLAIWLAMTSNFLLNRKFVFFDRRDTDALTQYARFCLSCLAGAVTNWTVRIGALGLMTEPNIRPDSAQVVIASLAGILGGMSFNYLLASRFAFRPKTTPGTRVWSTPQELRRTLKLVETSDAPQCETANSRATESAAIEPQQVEHQQRGLLAKAAALLIAGVAAATGNFGGWLSRPAIADRPPVISLFDSSAESSTAEQSEIESGAIGSAIGVSGTQAGSEPDRDIQIDSGDSASTKASPSRTDRVFAFADMNHPSKDTKKMPPAVEKATVTAESVEGEGEYHPLAVKLDASSIEARLKHDAVYLASDELEGRGARTDGLELAARFIAREFDEAGLNTSHYQGTPYQEFELFSLGGEGAYEELLFRTANSNETLDAGADFSTMTFVKSPAEAPVVFAGFGATIPEASYDDFAGLNVSGSIVILLRQLPLPLLNNGSRDLTTHTWLRTKVSNAIRRGAVGVIVCSDRSTLDSQATAEGREVPEILVQQELVMEPGDNPVPVLHCRRSSLQPLLKTLTGFDLDEAEAGINASLKPHSRPLADLRLKTTLSTRRRGRVMRNVIATLDGDATHGEETIVIGAHYDHLGRGSWGSLSASAGHEIHNGADDNASGTAVLLECSRQLAARARPLKRRVLFIAFSAEELGLIGSRRYVREPLVPISDTICMLNLDMVGRLRNDRLTIYGTGTSPAWPNLLIPAANAQKLEFQSRSGGFGPSDHASFYEKGVPVLHFFTGFHPQYHRPGDDAELLNIDGMRRISGMVTDLVIHMADAPESIGRSRTVQELAESSTLSVEQLLGGGLNTASSSRPTLGLVPTTAPNNAGVKVEQTLKNSPADRNGIRTGDLIQSVNGEAVKTVDDLARLVQAHTRSQPLTLRLTRNGIQLELQIQL